MSSVWESIPEILDLKEENKLTRLNKDKASDKKNIFEKKIWRFLCAEAKEEQPFQ